MGSRISNFMSGFGRSTLPVVVVLGATGTGKSKLAIELAKKFNGEIISADSMQVYQGLDIITNKVTSEEQQQAVHHFINCVSPLSRYTVVDFRNRALPLITNLLQRNKLPIIVGGTNYYIESLLWDVLVKPEDLSDTDKLLYELEKNLQRIRFPERADNSIVENYECSNSHSVDSVLTQGKSSCNDSSQNNLRSILENKITQDSASDISSDILHKLLLQVDPAMASTLHPNDKRKIIRSLQVYQQCELPHSEILAMQRSQNGGCSLGGPLRLKKSIMLWIQCDKSVLEKRLDERIDKMIENGLVDELLDFHRAYNKQRLLEQPDASYTEGIFQSIGFKEFHDYLLLPEEEKTSEKGIKMYKRGVEDMKLVTKRYAKKQLKWIKNRFLRKPDRDLPPVYGLNGSDLSHWQEEVHDVAYDIVNSVLQDKSPNVSPLPVEERVEDIPKSHYCDVCDRVIIGKKTWETHLASRTHERRKKGQRKRALLASM